MVSPVVWTSPNGGGDDYDWSFYDITSGCPTAASTALACDYNFCPGSTGFSATGAAGFGQVGGTDYQDDNPAGPGSCVGGPQWNTTTVNLVAGNTYGLFVQNYSASTGGVDISFGGTAVMGQPADFAAALDATCMTVTVDRTPFYTGANSTYFWNFGDGFTSTSGAPGPHTYAATGTYTLSLTVTDAVGCITTFSIPVDIGCILPIELLDFTANYNGSTVDLNWRTASEINNDFFTIERTKDGFTFEVVAIVEGSGNTNTIKNYNNEDEHPFNGTSYYRLKQTDFDGEFSVSNLVPVTVATNFGGLNVYPNPVVGVSVLAFEATRGGVFNVVIYDLSGRIVLTNSYDVNKGTNKLKLSTMELSSGMYFLTIGNINESEKIKFIKN